MRAPRPSPDLTDLLLQLVRERDPASPSAELLAMADAVDLTRLADAAAFHGITPAAYAALHDHPGVPSSVVTALEHAHRSQWQLHLRALADLAALASVLDALGVAWVVVKGPVLSECLYSSVSVRAYGDLDVLVERRTFPAVLSALEAAGASVVDRNWTMVHRGVRGEMTLRLRHGTTLDLHWHLFVDPPVRRAFSVAIDELLARRRTMSVNGIPVPTLDPADTVVHLATHATLGGGHRLVWLKDVDQAVRNDTPAWDEVVARARRWRLALPVGTMLARTRRTLGAPVPPEVLDALAPALGWRSVVALAGRVSPPHRSYARPLSLRTLVACTRQSTPSSLVELGRVALAEVVRPLVAERRTPWRPRSQDGVAAPNPLHEAAGEDLDRERFLALLAQAPVDP